MSSRTVEITDTFVWEVPCEGKVISLKVETEEAMDVRLETFDSRGESVEILRALPDEFVLTEAIPLGLLKNTQVHLINSSVQPWKVTITTETIEDECARVFTVGGKPFEIDEEGYLIDKSPKPAPVSATTVTEEETEVQASVEAEAAGAEEESE